MTKERFLELASIGAVIYVSGTKIEMRQLDPNIKYSFDDRIGWENILIDEYVFAALFTCFETLTEAKFYGLQFVSLRLQISLKSLPTWEEIINDNLTFHCPFIKIEKIDKTGQLGLNISSIFYNENQVSFCNTKFEYMDSIFELSKFLNHFFEKDCKIELKNKYGTNVLNQFGVRL